MNRKLGITTSLLMALLVCRTAIAQTTLPFRGAVPKPPVGGSAPRLVGPQMRKVRWLSFTDEVNYAVVDARRRTWFLMKDKDGKHAQYVCPEVPKVQLVLPVEYRTLGVDAADRFWLATCGGLFYYDLKTGRKVVKNFKGLFASDPDTGWPSYHPGQVYWSHSSGRVYCHDVTGVHVFDGKQWTFRKWSAEVLGDGGRIDLAAAKMQAVEAPGGLTIIWAAGDRLKGFWTHDGKVWRHYSSKSQRVLGDLTAVVPMSRQFVLICSKSKNAFVLDLASDTATAVPDTVVIINHLMQLEHKDPKIRAKAQAIVREMAIANSKKVTEAAGFIASEKTRKLALSFIAKVPLPKERRVKMPPGPNLALRDARLIARNSRGEALLTWFVGDGKKMGVYKPGAKVVEAPEKMSLEMGRRPDQSYAIAGDGSIVILTKRLWKWDGREFKLLCEEMLECVQVELLGIDAEGRIFMEAEGASDYVRSVCDPRYKGVEGTGLFGQIGPPQDVEPPLKTRD